MTAAHLHLPQAGKASAGAKPASKQYIARLQSFRGYGCVMVAMVHVAQAQWTPGKSLLVGPAPDYASEHWLAKLYLIVFNGPAALTMFFVLSGFVLFLSLSRGPTEFGASALRFTMARCVRIYPPVIATIALFTAIFYLFGRTIIPTSPSEFQAVPVLGNMLLTHVAINPVTWTLQLEMAAVPFIFLGFWLYRQYGPWPLLAVLVALIVMSFWGRWGRLLGAEGKMALMFTFVAGMLVPSLGRALVEPLSRRNAGRLMLVMAAVLLLPRTFIPKWAPLLETLSGAMLIAGIAYRPDLSLFRFLDWRPAVWFGRVSYSFYLVHPLTLLAINHMPETFEPMVRAGVHPLVLAVTVGFASTLVVAPVAALWYRLFEASAIKVIERIEKRPAISAVAR